MNSGILVDLYVANRFDTGSIRALYNFETGTSGILFNAFYPTGDQVLSGVITSPIFDTYPGLAVGTVNNVVTNSPSGAG